jgi:anthranilate synthase component 1
VPERGDFLLESVQGGEVRGRYSLVGLDPDLVFRATGETAQLNTTWQTDPAAFAPLPGNSLAELRAGRTLPDRRARRPAAHAGLPGRLFRL